MCAGGPRTAAAVACAGGGGARGRCWGTAKMQVSGSGWAESPCCCCIVGAGCGRLAGEVDWDELFLLTGGSRGRLFGHLAGLQAHARPNGGQNLGPQPAQLVGPPLSSKENKLPAGSASAGGGGVITTATSAKNANAITTDKISLGGRYNTVLCFTCANCTLTSRINLHRCV